VTDTAAHDVELIAWTEFKAPASVPWSTDAEGGQALAEFAGRACYQSWKKPNPATATNAGYLAHILDVGHLSVLEHGVATFYITGVSRSFTHELIRHRHLSYSQLSQRYVNEGAAAMIAPELIANDPEMAELFAGATGSAQADYRRLVDLAEKKLTEQGVTGTALRKQARQAARSVLPNATETRIVVTGNYRAWRHFIDMRATEAADVEIREVAVDILALLRAVAENVFADYRMFELPDGTVAATRA
jgi:thymidylate synthase (FAD)